MEPTDAGDVDVRLAPYLEAFASALDAEPAPLSPSMPGAPPELREELEGMRAVLRRLHRAVPRGGRSHQETPVAHATPPPDPGGAALPFGPPVPAQLGRFQIVRLLGSGGFGLVFLAWDPLLYREVALKVPRPDVVLTPDARRRFLDEGRHAAGLDHPSLVRVLDAGEAGPAVYLVAEYVAGPTLEAWLREQSAPVSVEAAAGVLAQLADAVDHMHGHGIVHRDLKPANVLLQGTNHRDTEDTEKTKDLKRKQTADPSSPLSSVFSVSSVSLWLMTPRITDFGLAKDLDAQTRLTQTGATVGTPLYMAPEQAEGRTKEVGPATDVYALGTILYELLTGQPPLRGPTDLDTLRRIASEEPAAPRRLRYEVPRDLETICLKCLEKEPPRRYRSAGGLRDDLRRFLAHETIQARPATAAERAFKWLRRRPALASGLALAGMALAAAVLGTLAYARQVGRHNEELGKVNTQLKDQEQRLARMLYASRLKLARQAVDAGNLMQAVEILDSLRPESDQEDPRGFEWHYLKGLCHPLHAIWRGHQRSVDEVTVSPDGKMVASGSGDQTVRLWDLATGQPRNILRISTVFMPSMHFSPDGRMLAVQLDGEEQVRRDAVWVWDLATARRQARFDLGDIYVGAPCRKCLLTPDGKRLIAIVPGGVAFWDPVTGHEIHRLARPKDVLYTPAVSPDGKVLALSAHSTCEARDFLVLCDLPAGRERAVLWGIKGPTYALAFSPDGRTLASGSDDGTIQLWDVPAASLRATLAGHRLPVITIAYSPDGRVVASAAWAGGRPAKEAEVRLWDAAVGDLLASLERYTGPVNSLAFVPNSRLLVVGCWDHTVKLVDTDAAPKQESLPGHAPKEVWALAFSPDGRTLASASDDHLVKLWDVATGKERAVLAGHESLVTAVAFSADGRTLASASYDETVRLWDAATGQLRTTLSAGQLLRCLTFSPDGKTLAAGTKVKSGPAEVKLWQVDTLQELTPLTGHGKTIRSVAFLGDGATLVSASEDGKVRLWETGSWRELRQLDDTDGIGCLAVAPDGRTLATGNQAGLVKLWDAATGQERAALRGHAQEVYALTFSPDGKTLATVGEDKTVRLWQASTGEELLTLTGHAARVNAVAFSSNGRTLATGDHTGAVRLWRGGVDP